MDPNDDNDSGIKKLKRKFGENPIVPLGLAFNRGNFRIFNYIGALITVGVLGFGLFSFFKGRVL